MMLYHRPAGVLAYRGEPAIKAVCWDMRTPVRPAFT
jgi:hypothetical protein